MENYELTSSGEKVKIFKINDYEWVAGERLFQCIKYLMGLTGETFSDTVDNAKVLSIEDLDELVYSYDLSQGEKSKKCSFRERLKEMIEERKEFPEYFATTEY